MSSANIQKRTVVVSCKMQNIKKKPMHKKKQKSTEVSLIRVSKNLKKNEIITENDIYLIKTIKRVVGINFSIKKVLNFFNNNFYIF